MPFYEYECSHCRYYSEVLQKITDKPLKKCPSCGKSTFKKLISAPVFRLKGSGWYETDFKGDNDHKRNLAGSDKDDGPSSASDAKADSKADAKTDSKTDSKSEGEAKADAKPADGNTAGSKGTTGKADAKPAGKAKTPPVTSRTVAGRGTRAQSSAKSSASRRPAPAKRKASKRRGGR